MAINWGVALGAAAKTGLDTYERLGEEQYRQMMREKMRREMAEKEAFRGVVKDAMGNVGQLPQTSTGALQTAAGITPDQQASAAPGAGEVRQGLRQAAGIQAGDGSAITAQSSIAPASTTPVSRSDAMMQVLNRGMAVAPEMAFDFVLKGLQLDDVIDTRQKRKDFQKELTGIRSNLVDLQTAADNADQNPEGVFTAAKKFGITLQPIATSPNSVAYEAYQDGKKIGQFNTLADAANSGIQSYYASSLGNLATRFATDPKDLVTIMGTLDQMEMRRRDANRADRADARAEQLLPAQIKQIEASIRASDANARKAGYEGDRLAQMQGMTKELSRLTKDPVKNAQEIIALSQELGILFPDVYIGTGKVTEDGVEKLTTVNKIEGVVGRRLATAGVKILPAGLKTEINAAAARANGDVKAFRKDPTVQNMVKSGKVTLAELEEVAFPNAAPASAIPATGPSSAAPTRPSSAVPAKEDYSNIFFSRMTPDGLVERAAAAGNKDAIAELNKRRTLQAARESIPLNTGMPY